MADQPVTWTCSKCGNTAIRMKPGGPAGPAQGRLEWICATCSTDVIDDDGRHWPDPECTECLASFIEAAAITIGRPCLTEEEIIAVRRWMAETAYRVLFDVDQGFRALHVIDGQAVDVEYNADEEWDTFTNACFRIGRLRETLESMEHLDNDA